MPREHPDPVLLALQAEDADTLREPIAADAVLRRPVRPAPFRGKAAVRRSALPTESRIADRFRGADLADAYAVALPPEAGGIDAVADRALGHPGPAFRAALALRDAVMGPLGVRTSNRMRSDLIRRGADRIDFFPVLSRSAREIVLGEDDTHLDFRLSLLVRDAPRARGTELVATTAVHCHGALGRAYLATILVGHLVVVRSALARAAAA